MLAALEAFCFICVRCLAHLVQKIWDLPLKCWLGASQWSSFSSRALSIFPTQSVSLFGKEIANRKRNYIMHCVLSEFIMSVKCQFLFWISGFQVARCFVLNNFIYFYKSSHFKYMKQSNKEEVHTHKWTMDFLFVPDVEDNVKNQELIFNFGGKYL